MRNPHRFVVGATATAALAGGLLLVVAWTEPSQAAQQSRRTQGSTGEVPRTEDGKPDFSGIWQAQSDANWDLLPHDARPMVGQPGYYKDVPVLAAPVVALGTVGWIPPSLGVVDGNEIPYQPWAAARQKENLANWLDRDPELKCYYRVYAALDDSAADLPPSRAERRDPAVSLHGADGRDVPRSSAQAAAGHAVGREDDDHRRDAEGSGGRAAVRETRVGES